MTRIRLLVFAFTHFSIFSIISARIGISPEGLAVKRQTQAPIEQFIYFDPDWNDQNGAHCYLGNACKDHSNPGPGVCGAGEIVIGWDYANCGGQQGKPVCCPSTTNVDNW